ncbi:DUF6900 domain-containing protein [Murdochiella vaginalis]|uniref:DUF6900 domain-containing protein n=1 Tax=Murdochiella vaginalis TaxID=1852373 RepID=UPI0008FE1086|nr:hypothetical protein [Murdochiella vaginalis]
MTNKEHKAQIFQNTTKARQAKIEEQITKLAFEMMPSLEGRSDLEEHGNDAEDFLETSIWSLKDALMAAYRLGQQNA